MDVTERHDLPYRLAAPARATTSAVFASPHSGRDYPADMLRRTGLDMIRLRSSEDAFIDDLIAPAPAFGAPALCARWPRAYVDLNRAEDELDPALIEDVEAGGRGARVMAGLGVIPRVVSGGRAIYSGKLPRAEAEDRLARVWRPYHAALNGLIGAARARFGRALLFDLHSMPSEAVDQLGPRRPDVVLGDRFGASARRETSLAVERAFLRAGFHVARNAPFAGAYVTQRYGRPRDGVEAIQIEINRGLYMDERTIEPLARFAEFRAVIETVLRDLADIGRDGGDALAAE